jgi:hypothetical protein
LFWILFLFNLNSNHSYLVLPFHSSNSGLSILLFLVPLLSLPFCYPRSVNFSPSPPDITLISSLYHLHVPSSPFSPFPTFLYLYLSISLSHAISTHKFFLTLSDLFLNLSLSLCVSLSLPGGFVCFPLFSSCLIKFPVMEPQQLQQQNHPHQQQQQQNEEGIGSSNKSSFLCRQSTTRWTPTTEQIRILKDLYYNNGVRSPSAEQIQKISAKLRQYGKIEGKNVFYWFQNHKARERQKKRLTTEIPMQRAGIWRSEDPIYSKCPTFNSAGDFSRSNCPSSGMP